MLPGVSSSSTLAVGEQQAERSNGGVCRTTLRSVAGHLVDKCTPSEMLPFSSSHIFT